MDFIVFTSDPNHGSLYFSNFIKNYENNKIYKQNYFCETQGNKVVQISKVLKKDIREDFSKIILSKNLESLLKYNQEDLSIYLYNQCFLKKKYDESYLKFLILVCNKYKNSHEILALCRYLLDSCDLELFIKILIYNHLLKSIYCSYGDLNELFQNCNYQKYYKNYRTIKKLYQKNENNFISWDNRQFLLDPEDVVNPLIKVLSYCRFYDENNREFYSADSNFEEDEKIIKIIRQNLKEKYIGNEKWINQYSLYQNTKNIFKDTGVTVLREYSPRCLGLQRLDVYFELNGQKIAFEYQGEQHYKPIDFFGGVSAFEKRIKLDERKKTKCKRNSIKLIEFKYTDSVSINSIIGKLKQNNINIKGDCYV